MSVKPSVTYETKRKYGMITPKELEKLRMWFFKLNWSDSMINTREIAAELRLSHWAGIMRERTRSGQSIKAFCRQIGICQNTYFYWQRRVRAAACTALPDKTSGFTDTVTKTEKALIPHGWAQVAEVEPAPASSSVLTVQVGDCRLSVDAGTDLELLSKVCRVLKAL